MPDAPGHKHGASDAESSVNPGPSEAEEPAGAEATGNGPQEPHQDRPQGEFPGDPRRGDDRPAIRLDNVLKLAGIVETGGQAKRLIQAGEVRVNGEVETRRKHLLHEGDEVEVEGETFVVELTTEEDLEDDLYEEDG